MKKQIWILVVIILLALMIGGFAWMNLSRDSAEGSPSPNGETEIIPDDPNDPWPDLTEETASDDSSGSDPVNNTPTFGTAPEPSANENSVISGISPGSGSSGSADSSVASDGSDGADGADTPDSTPGISNPTPPDSGTTDSSPVVREDGLHEYELPYISLS